MLSLIRSLVRNPIFGGFIIVLLIAAFALFGVENIFRGGGTSAIIVGSEQVSVAEVQRAYDLELRRQQENDPSNAAQLANDPAIGNAVVRQLLQDAAFNAKAAELSLTISDAELARFLTGQEVFQNLLTGEFDRFTYLNVVRQQGYLRGDVERQFEADQAKRLAQFQYISSSLAGVRLPDVMAVAGNAFINENRSLQALLLPPSLAGDIPEPTDEILSAFIENNAAQFLRPEQRRFTLVRISPDMITGDIAVDEQAVQDLFEFRLEQGGLTEPATRSLSQWPANDQASALAAVEQLRAGADIDSVAAEFGLGTRVDLDTLQGFEIPDIAIADAAFEMSVGEFQAVEARLGWRVVEVTTAFDPVTPTLATARSELVAELTEAESSGVVIDTLNAFVEAQSAGATIEVAARTAGIPAEVFDFTAADGAINQSFYAHTFINRDPNIDSFLTPDAQRILETAFSLPIGFESDLEPMTEGGYFMLRVDEVEDARVSELSEIRELAEQRWRLAEVQNQLLVVAQAAQARAEAGEDLSTIAADFDGARVEQTVRSRRELFSAPNERNPLDPFVTDLLATSFQTPKDGVFISVAGADRRSLAVVRVLDVIAPETESIGPELQFGLTQQLENDLYLSLASMLVENYEASTDQRLLDLALRRVDPAEFQ